MPATELPLFESKFFTDSNLERTRRKFADVPNRMIGIKRPDYLLRREVPQNLASVAPNARILTVLRDPANRLVSACIHYMKLGLIPVVQPNEVISEVLEHGSYRGIERSRELWEYGLYAKGLRHWLRHFERDVMLVLESDDLLPGGDVGKRVAAFLDLDTPVEIPTARINEGVYDLRRLRVISKRTKHGPSWDNTSSISFHNRLWRRPWYLPLAGLVEFYDRLLVVNGLTKPDIDAELVDKVRSRYIEQDSCELEGLIGLIPSWMH